MKIIFIEVSKEHSEQVSKGLIAIAESHRPPICFIVIPVDSQVKIADTVEVD